MTNDQIVKTYIGSAKMRGKEVCVLVEDLKDIAFWNGALVKTTKRSYDFNPYHSGKSYLKNFFNHTNKDFIICLDADIEPFAEHSFINNRPPFLYHTYTHSRENHLAYPNSLNHWLQGKIGTTIEDIEMILNDISNKLTPVLVYHILFEQNGQFKRFLAENSPDWSAFLDTVNRGIKTNFEKEIQKQSCLSWDVLKVIVDIEEDLQNIVSLAHLKTFSFTFLDNALVSFKKAVDQVINDYNRLDLTEPLNDVVEKFNQIVPLNDTIYFFQGHVVHDKILIPLMKKLLEICAIEQKQEIDKTKQIKDKEARKNQIDKSLVNNELNYEFCLLNDRNCKYLSLLFKDIENDFNA